MLDEDSQPVIIDLDSCVGRGLPKKYKVGTVNWMRESEFSEEENDMYGLQKIREWLKKDKKDRLS